ncbi:hypothetical protein FIBSPDRAFT_955743 [Athelia psychrophila]|uniref:Carbonic anhydrase n=1 Tax=Athelia psychrophila TaxID=1759441 RepID=A0A166HLE1_9AGAM|nr:hypothetical protein FIBSPDRAFT_955743 [Fibularhizoctonia sp. CBS 109695]
MDCRINSFEQIGLNFGEAHIIRTAGGTAEAIRSIIVSQRAETTATEDIAIFHHTDCGMAETL